MGDKVGLSVSFGMRTGTGGDGETVEFVDTINKEGLAPELWLK